MRSLICLLVLGFSLIFCLFLLVVPTAESIKCWNCNSAADPKCADPFDNTSLPIVDCDAKKLERSPGLQASMCRKIRQKVNGYWRFIRQCAFLGQPGEGKGDENYCLMRTGTYNVFIETCTCNSKDGCNSASLRSISFSFLLSFVFVVLIVHRVCLRT